MMKRVILFTLLILTQLGLSQGLVGSSLTINKKPDKMVSQRQLLVRDSITGKIGYRLFPQSGTGGSQTLQQVSDTGGLDNGSTIRQGVYNEGTGGNGGIELVCSVGYPLKWEGGALYSKEADGVTNRLFYLKSGLDVKDSFKVTSGSDSSGINNYSTLETSTFNFSYLGVSGSDGDNFGQVSFGCSPEDGVNIYARDNELTRLSTLTTSKENVEIGSYSDDGTNYIRSLVRDTGEAEETIINQTTNSIDITSPNGLKINGDRAVTFADFTLQNLLNNNHTLYNGNNFQGAFAGDGQTGTNAHLFGDGAGNAQSGNSVNGFGNSVLQNQTGSNVNAFGFYSGLNNTFSNVNLFGYYSQADDDNQTVFSKDMNTMIRLDYSRITGLRKQSFSDQNGVIALIDDTNTLNTSTTTAPSSRVFRNAINNKESLSNKVQTLIIEAELAETAYPSVLAVSNALSQKQPTLLSGTNIKTINGSSLLSSGNLAITDDNATISSSDITSPSSRAVKNNLDLKQNLSAKGVSNGYASLDSNGKVPLSQINDALVGSVNYKGTWNASTNTPDLTAIQAKGSYYVASAAGTHLLMTFGIGDWIISDGTSWGKLNNSSTVTSVAGRSGVVILTKSDVGLTNVDNTTDTNKPISTAQQIALDLKANITSPTFTGTVNIPTGAIFGGNFSITGGSTATYIQGNGVPANLGNNIRSNPLTGLTTGTNTPITATSSTISAFQDLQAQVSAKANTASPTFTGTVTIPSGGFALSGGTTTQYLRGDGSTATFSTGVRTTGLSTLTTGTNTPITSSHTVTTAFQDLQAQIFGIQSDYRSASFTAQTGVNYVLQGNNLVVSDPASPVIGKGYSVYIIGGLNNTVGSFTSDTYGGGSLVYRFWNGSAWVSNDIANMFGNNYCTTGVNTLNNTKVDKGVDNSTTIALTSATLDSTYPSSPTGFRVYCTAIITGKMVYEKTPTGWIGSAVIIP